METKQQKIETLTAKLRALTNQRKALNQTISKQVEVLSYKSQHLVIIHETRGLRLAN